MRSNQSFYNDLSVQILTSKTQILSILQKYILREWSWTALAVSVLLIIVVLGAYLADMLKDIAGGRVPAGLIGMQLLLHMPVAIGNILPLAGFVAVMWGLGRIYRDQEMAVMRSSGFGWTQLLRPLFTLMIPLAVVLLYMGLSLAPRSAQMAEQQLEQAFRSAAVWGLQAGKFHVLKQGELVLYAEAFEADGSTLRNIFIKQRHQDREQVWVAQKGRYWMDEETGERYLVLENGKVVDLAPGQMDVKVLGFARNDLRLPEPEIRSRKGENIDKKPSLELLSNGNAESRAELQWRISPAITIIVLGLLAIPLSHSEPREGRGIRIILGILVYLLYGNMLYLCRTWMIEGILPTFIGMWWIHAIFLLISFVWVRRQGRFAVKANVT